MPHTLPINSTPQRAARRASSYPLLTLSLGLAVLAATSALPADHRSLAPALVPSVVLCALAWAASRLPAWRTARDREPYGVLAAASGFTVLLVGLTWVGPLRVIALAVLVLGLIGRDLRLAIPAAAVLISPLDTVGLALVSPQAYAPLVPAQLAVSALLLALGVGVYRRESAVLARPAVSAGVPRPA